MSVLRRRVREHFSLEWCILPVTPLCDYIAMPNITDNRRYPAGIGPVKDKLILTIGNDDYEYPQGFLCTVLSSGDLTYRTLNGTTDITETVTANSQVQAGGQPLLLSAIRSTSTVSSVDIGFP